VKVDLSDDYWVAQTVDLMVVQLVGMTGVRTVAKRAGMLADWLVDLMVASTVVPMADQLGEILAGATVALTAEWMGANWAETKVGRSGGM
jgi:hypothetical protein